MDVIGQVDMHPVVDSVYGEMTMAATLPEDPQSTTVPVGYVCMLLL